MSDRHECSRSPTERAGVLSLYTACRPMSRTDGHADMRAEAPPLRPDRVLFGCHEERPPGCLLLGGCWIDVSVGAWRRSGIGFVPNESV